MSTTRLPFEIDPAIIHHIIHSQAGSIGKALLELVMNGIDAQATKVWLTITREGFICTDDGNGFATREDVVRYFGRFGTPHMEGDATYGRFRLGRGQIMAHAHTHWSSRRWSMDVDTKRYGHFYDLTERGTAEATSEASGCRIEGKWYEPLSELELQSTVQEIRDLVKYTPAELWLNDRLVSKNPANERWDHEDDVAYYRVKAEGAVSIYNLGVLVRHDPGHVWGAGGLMVSKRAIDLNVSRTEILRKTCPTWRHMAAAFGPMADAIAQRLGNRKTEERRERATTSLLCGAGDIYRMYREEEVITILPGKRHISLAEFVRRINRQRRAAHPELSCVTIVECDEDVPKGERIARLGAALVLHPQTLQRFRCEDTVEFNEALAQIYDHVATAICEATKGDTTRFDARCRLALPSFVAFAVLRDGFIERSQIVDERKRFDKETRRAWTALRWCLSHYAGACLGFPMQQDGRVAYDYYARLPLIIVGESNSSDAWTDGRSYVAFNARHVEHLRTQPLLAAAKLFSMLDHEMAHQGDSLGAGHDEVFYQRYHDLSLLMAEQRQRYMHLFLCKYTRSMSGEGKGKSTGGKAWGEHRLLELAREQRTARGLAAGIPEPAEASVREDDVPAATVAFIDDVNRKLDGTGHVVPPVDWARLIADARRAQEEDAIHTVKRSRASAQHNYGALLVRAAAVLGMGVDEFLDRGGSEFMGQVEEHDTDDTIRDGWLSFLDWCSAVNTCEHDEDVPTEFEENHEADPQQGDIGIGGLFLRRNDLVRGGETATSLCRNAAAAGFFDVDSYLEWRTDNDG